MYQKILLLLKPRTIHVFFFPFIKHGQSPFLSYIPPTDIQCFSVIIEIQMAVIFQ